MIILIDAYNVLKRDAPHLDISYQDRVRFIALLTHYQKIKEHGIVIVFDGGDALWPTEHKQRHVTVVYSGANRSADDYIKQYIARNAHKELLLVSSDRELALWANKHHVVIMASEDFMKFVQSATMIRVETHHETPTVKMDKVEDEDFDAYMERVAEHIEYKAEDNMYKVASRSMGSASLHDKKMLRLLKKL